MTAAPTPAPAWVRPAFTLWLCAKHDNLPVRAGEKCFLCAAEQRFTARIAARRLGQREIAFRQLNPGDRE